MFRLIICLVFIILRAEANVTETENPEVRLFYSHDRNENFTVWKGKPLKIIIENVYARYVWCFNKYITSDGLRNTTVERFVPTTEFTNSIIAILNIKNVTAAMSTRWACTVLQEYHGPATPYIYRNRKYTPKDLHFNLYVKGARAVNLTTNNQSLTYATTNLSVNYDGEVNYTYEAGEDFSITCKKIGDYHTEDTLRLEYYDAEGIPLFQTKPQVKPQTFRSMLKSNNDKYYLDCVRAARDPEREYRYRTTFFKSDLHAETVQHAVILSVNGQKLTSLNNDYYTFRYIDGEILTVTCQKIDVNMRGSLIFYGDIMMNQTFSPSEPVISLNISTSKIKNKHLICGINNTNLKQPNARLLFLSDVPANDVRIRGLSRNNVLYQYTYDLNQWIIEYQYSVNDTLNLICVSNKGFHGPNQPQPRPNTKPFQWKFEDQVMIDSAAIGTPGTPIMFSEQSFTMILSETHNGNKIKCTYLEDSNSYIKKQVEIILRLKQELVSEAKRDKDTFGDNPKHMIVVIAVGVGVAIAIITMVCLVSWRKRTKWGNLIENAYDNISDQNDSPIPAFPSQWEANYDDSNYAKIDEEVMQENYNYSGGNDKLNSMPHKRQSNTSENQYTEIDDYFKPKPDGLAANWNSAQPSNYNKQTETLKPAASHSSNNACYNNFSDSKQGAYDKLRHFNLPNNKGSENYSNVQKPSKCKSVTFKQISNDLRPERNYSEGNSTQDGRNNDRKLKLNNDSYYANTSTSQDIYMQPGDMHKKPNYENHYLQNDKTDNQLDSDYAETYDEHGISCKNDFYG